MVQQDKQRYFAEVVESSLQSFTAQTWQWDNFPAFGSLVCVQGKQRTLFGIVYQVQTGSMDPSRYPFPYQKRKKNYLSNSRKFLIFYAPFFRAW
jgi:hypothetical protein